MSNGGPCTACRTHLSASSMRPGSHTQTVLTCTPQERQACTTDGSVHTSNKQHCSNQATGTFRSTSLRSCCKHETLARSHVTNAQRAVVVGWMKERMEKRIGEKIEKRMEEKIEERMGEDGKKDKREDK